MHTGSKNTLCSMQEQDERSSESRDGTGEALGDRKLECRTETEPLGKEKKGGKKGDSG